jgi:hypothetical protein
MAPKITPEMRAALAKAPGRPVTVEDDETQKQFVLVDADRGRELTEQWIREQLQLGIAAINRGEIVSLDAAAIKAGGRRRAARD